jgi:S1-C subfamily serine protease
VEIVDLISKARSGVLQILLERNREWIGFGSGFLVKEGIVTCSHNIRAREFDAVAIRFEESDPRDPDSFVRFDPKACVAAESPEGEKDFAFLRIWEKEFDGRHVFGFVDTSTLSVGSQIAFLGFPFGMPQLTSHIGFVSSLHERSGIQIVQIDGSVNGGNSGGPVLELGSGKVAGIVTRAITGIVEEQFDRLVDALRANQQALQQVRGVMAISGGGVKIDPIDALRASQAAMEQIAKDLKRSANVGIGYAYSANYVRDEIGRFVGQE